MPSQNLSCPLCGGEKKRKIFKNESFFLFSCAFCGSNYQERLASVQKDYEESYFHENHKKAYGKSYLEDEENIRSFSRRRLRVIKKLLGKTKEKAPKILDIGSALGIFCDEAAQFGFEASGLEISEFARNFSKERFGIRTFSNIGKIQEEFDVVTLWFTLEHIQKPLDLLNALYPLLSRTGIITISLPHAKGAFARWNKGVYYLKRPVEHFFEPSVKGIKILLKKAGFTVEKTEFFGLHPERVGLPEWNSIKNIQKTLKLGDTFEIYGRKKYSSDSN
jgi:2-polyprenyl-3-methyl-5-hydroxy-6-metoxy-1,4-benzoquinol methylase